MSVFDVSNWARGALASVAAVSGLFAVSSTYIMGYLHFFPVEYFIFLDSVFFTNLLTTFLLFSAVSLVSGRIGFLLFYYLLALTSVGFLRRFLRYFKRIYFSIIQTRRYFRRNGILLTIACSVAFFLQGMVGARYAAFIFVFGTIQFLVFYMITSRHYFGKHIVLLSDLYRVDWSRRFVFLSVLILLFASPLSYLVGMAKFTDQAAQVFLVRMYGTNSNAAIVARTDSGIITFGNKSIEDFAKQFTFVTFSNVEWATK